MKRASIVLTLAAVFAAIVVLSPTITAYNNGIGDSNEDYGCSTDCHTVQSSSVITMSSSKSTPTPGETVTVTVNVTGGEASNAPFGVMILSALTSSGSLPSDAGWTIVSDPTGTTAFNYHEIPAYTSSVSWTWTLTAPSTAGIYTLYAREIHGNGDTYSRDYTAGLAFVVGSAGPPGKLSVIITSPGANTEVWDSITVAASLIPSTNISYAVLSIDGTEVDNKTSAPFSWTIDTRLYADGAHVFNITASNETGARGYEEITVTINNSGRQEELLTWMWTMAAGTIFIVAMVGSLIAVALMVRKHHMDKKVK